MQYPKHIKYRVEKFLLCLLLCLGGGWLSGLATQTSLSQWYPHLIKSIATPPPIVFPIAWTILYTLMAVTLFLLWISPSKNKTSAYIAFSIQLVFNFLWSSLFFYLKNPALGFIDIVLLWIALVATIFLIRKHSKIGAYLQIPYLLWTSFALYLNLIIYIYNP